MKQSFTLILSFLTVFVSAYALAGKEIKSAEEYRSYVFYEKKSESLRPYNISVARFLSNTNYKGGFQQNVVVEEATGTWCGYCPAGIMMCEYIRQNYSDRIFPIAVHQGDKMAIAEYQNFIDEYVDAFPTAMANRCEYMEVSNHGADLIYEQIKDKKTYARIEIEAKLDGNTLSIESTTEFAIDTDVEHRLAYVIVEDGVGPYMQMNYYGSYDEDLGMWNTAGNRVRHYFNDVARHISTFEGIKGSLPSNVSADKTYSHNFTMELSNVSVPTFRIIGMILNSSTGEIVNSGQCSVMAGEGMYIDKGILDMTIGEHSKLTVYVDGKVDSAHTFSWSSSDEKVALVDNEGNVTACGEGSTVITVSWPGGSAECHVNVDFIGSIFEIEGIRYRITSDSTCMVALPEEGEHYMMEKIVIPAEIEVQERRIEVNELEFTFDGFRSAFSYSPNLKEIELPNTISVLPGDALEGCRQLETFRIPSSVTFIDAYAFHACTNLSHLELNEGLTDLWTWACAWCENLNNIVLPSTLERMGREVFSCTPLDWIHSKASVPPVMQGDLFCDEIFADDYATCALLVPESNISAYKEAEYWSRFEMILPDDVILNKYKLTLDKNDMYRLSVLNCGDMPVFWSSDDDTVATVDDNGNVMAHSIGETVVRAECNGKATECRVEISSVGRNVKVDELWYNITTANTCSVIASADEEVYTTETVIVPDKIEVDGKYFDVTEVAFASFQNFPDLTHLILPYSVYSIKNMALSWCVNLSHLDLNEGLTDLQSRACAWCGNLSEIILPSTLEKIGKEVFYNVPIERIHSKALIPPILDGDLFNDKEVSENYAKCVLMVPENSISAYKEAEYWNRFDLIVSDDVILNNYRLSLNPNDSYQLKVLNCDDRAVLWHSDNEEAVTVDDSGCINAKALGEATIIAECNGKSAECKVKVAMDGLCGKVDGLWYSITDINTCEVIRPIDSDYYYLEKVTIPSKVKLFGQEYIVSSIGNGAFRDNQKLKWINMPNTLKRIGDDAFLWCDSLEKLTIPSSVDEIGQAAFEKCSSITEIDLPENLSDISSYTFEGCIGLKKVNIPNSVIKIGECAFAGCSALEEIIIPEHITILQHSTFIGCSNLHKVILPRNLETISGYVFENCSKLEEIVIPADVSVIGAGCFVKSNLRQLIMEGITPPDVRFDLFEEGGNQYEVCELIVPEEGLSLYHNHYEFGKFTHIRGNEAGVENIVEGERRCYIYSIGGELVEQNVYLDEVRGTLLPGIYVVRYPDNKTQKLIVR